MMIRTSHGKVYYHLTGVRGDIPIVFTHGFALDHQTWSDQVKVLSNDMKTLTWDFPGCGNSYELNEPLSFSDAAECLCEILDREDIHEAVFVGQSMGSLFNQYFSSMNPEIVYSLIHVGGFPLHGGFSTKAITMMGLHTKILKLMPRNLIYKMFGRLVARSRDGRKYVKKTSEKMGKEQMILLEKGLIQDIEASIPELIDKPQLLLVGEHENPLIKKKNRKWIDLLTEAEMATIPGAGHIANHDKPEAITKHIQDFIQRTCTQDDSKTKK